MMAHIHYFVTTRVASIINNQLLITTRVKVETSWGPTRDAPARQAPMPLPTLHDDEDYCLMYTTNFPAIVKQHTPPPSAVQVGWPN